MAFAGTGAGDSLTFGLPAGAGSPVGEVGFGAGDYFPLSAGGFAVVTLATFLSGRVAADGDWVGEEGGYIISLYAPSGVFTDPEYLVKLRDANHQAWPLTEAGCHSTFAGLAHSCRPQFAGTLLQFASPRVPRGVYRVQLTGASGVAYSIPVTLRSVPQPSSREVWTIRRRLPNTVYNPFPEAGP